MNARRAPESRSVSKHRTACRWRAARAHRAVTSNGRLSSSQQQAYVTQMNEHEQIVNDCTSITPCNSDQRLSVILKMRRRCLSARAIIQPINHSLLSPNRPTAAATPADTCRRVSARAAYQQLSPWRTSWSTRVPSPRTSFGPFCTNALFLELAGRPDSDRWVASKWTAKLSKWSAPVTTVSAGCRDISNRSNWCSGDKSWS